MANIKQRINKIRWQYARAYARYKLKGVFNCILSKIDAGLHLPFAFAQPTMARIRIVEGICNLSCRICPQAQVKYKSVISLEFFKKILDCVKYCLNLHLAGCGEPFMVKDIFEMITYAKSKGYYIGLSTNMTLVDKDLAEKIIKSKLDYLCVSIDAATKELFEKIRSGARFESVIHNIEILNEVKKHHNSKNPKIIFWITVMKENIHQMTGIIELGHRLGVEKILANALVVFGSGFAVKEQSLTNYPKLAQEEFSEAHRRARKLDIDFIYPQLSENNIKARYFCTQPWGMLNILVDGTITPCCNYNTAFGNIFKDNIGLIWNNKNMHLVRKIARKKGSVCHYCLQNLNVLETKTTSSGALI